MKLACLAFGAALSLAVPGLALADCTRPAAPTVADGATATADQLMANKQAVVTFIPASDDYQTCVLADLKAKADAARKARTKLDPAVKKSADDAISANQADKEKVGADFNAAVKAFKAAHPS